MSDIVEQLRTARARGERPSAPGADLSGADLSGADLRWADLRRAELSWAKLSWADLRWADLRGADLRGADLRWADLRWADLRWVELRWVELRWADLRWADLRWANLYGADLRWVDQRWATWDGLRIDNLPSGQLTLIPTHAGWMLTIGCWDGTPDGLRELIAQDDGWPEAEGEEIARRRPLLKAALTLCEAHMADRAHVIDDLRKRWGR